MNKYLTRFLFFLVIALSIGLSIIFMEGDLSGEEKNEIEYELVLCKGIKNNLPRDITNKFHTREKIYSYLYIDKIKNGLHKIEFYWYNPKNKIQETYKNNIDVKDNIYNIWSWIELKDTELLFERSFTGSWRVEIYIDNEFLTRKYFSVT